MMRALPLFLGRLLRAERYFRFFAGRFGVCVNPDPATDRWAAVDSGC